MDIPYYNITLSVTIEMLYVRALGHWLISVDFVPKLRIHTGAGLDPRTPTCEYAVTMSVAFQSHREEMAPHRRRNGAPPEFRAVTVGGRY